MQVLDFGKRPWLFVHPTGGFHALPHPAEAGTTKKAANPARCERALNLRNPRAPGPGAPESPQILFNNHEDVPHLHGVPDLGLDLFH
jgi:hypothetical protein